MRHIDDYSLLPNNIKSVVVIYLNHNERKLPILFITDRNFQTRNRYKAIEITTSVCEVFVRLMRDSLRI